MDTSRHRSLHARSIFCSLAKKGETAHNHYYLQASVQKSKRAQHSCEHSVGILKPHNDRDGYGIVVETGTIVVWMAEWSKAPDSSESLLVDLRVVHPGPAMGASSNLASNKGIARTLFASGGRVVGWRRPSVPEWQTTILEVNICLELVF